MGPLEFYWLYISSLDYKKNYFISSTPLKLFFCVLSFSKIDNDSCLYAKSLGFQNSLFSISYEDPYSINNCIKS
jgi:hypothetical protein